MGKKLLVIEGKVNHQKDAKRCLETKFKDVEINFANTYKDALQMLEYSPYDGVLSDVFLPTEDPCDKKRIMLYFEEDFLLKTLSKTLYKDELPYGILIGRYAFERKLPIVLITNTYHNSEKNGPIYDWSNRKKVPFVSRDFDKKSCKEEGLDYRCDNYEHVFRRKDWFKGFLVLLWMINCKNIWTIRFSSEGIDTSIMFDWSCYLLEEIESGIETMSENYFYGVKESRETLRQTVKRYFKHCS